MRKSRNFLSLPVFSLEEGSEIGRVRGLVINPQQAEVAALIVQRSGFFAEQKVIPYPRVVSAGDNALTVQKACSAEKMASLPQILNLVKENVSLRGSRVITEGGSALGFVEEFYVDANTGRITAFEIGGHFTEGLLKGKAILPASEVRTIGKDVVVVHNGAENSLSRNEGGFGDRMKGLKESTGRFLERARQLYTKKQEDEAAPPAAEQAPAAPEPQPREQQPEARQEEQPPAQPAIKDIPAKNPAPGKAEVPSGTEPPAGRAEEEVENRPPAG